MDNGNLQSLQVARKHSPLCVIQSGHVLRTRLSENTSGEGNEIATLVHGTNGSIAIEIEFAYASEQNEDEIPIPGRMD